MRALIDGDIIAHRVGWTVEDQDSFGIPKWRTDEMLDGILADTNATEFQIYLSGAAESNFRYRIYPRYKESRIGKPRPKWLIPLEEYLITQWGATVADGMEADDALGINQDQLWKDTVICTIDKDLKQIPGCHYNFVTKEHSYVEEFDGLRSFYRQIITGDSGDDIPGINGLGPKKSDKLLKGCTTEDSLLAATIDAYRQDAAKLGLPESSVVERIRLTGSLVKIKQSEDEEIWDSPLLKQMEDLMRSFTPPKLEESGQSTEPIGSVETDTGGSL